MIYYTNKNAIMKAEHVCARNLLGSDRMRALTAAVNYCGSTHKHYAEGTTDLTRPVAHCHSVLRRDLVKTELHIPR